MCVFLFVVCWFSVCVFLCFWFCYCRFFFFFVGGGGEFAGQFFFGDMDHV